MKSKNLVFILVSLVAVIPSSFAYAVTLQNPGFENWTGGAPNGWNISTISTGTAAGEYSVSESDAAANEGQKSAKIHFYSYPSYGTFNIDTNIYQTVSGVSVGQAYVFDIRKMCQIIPFPGLAGQGDVTMVAGIDPYGGADPLSPAIVWGNPLETGYYTSDLNFVPLSAETTAQSPNITIFLKTHIWASTYLHSGTVTYGTYFGTSTYVDSAELNPIPEPATLLLVGFGSLFLGLRRRKIK